MGKLNGLGMKPGGWMIRAIGPGGQSPGFASVTGFGPGGGQCVASIFSPNRRYEVQVILSTSSAGARTGFARQAPAYARQMADPLALVSKVAQEIRSLLFSEK